jgi:hypothetical protein
MQIHAPQTANTSFGTIPRGSRIAIDASGFLFFDLL